MFSELIKYTERKTYGSVAKHESPAQHEFCDLYHFSIHSQCIFFLAMSPVATMVDLTTVINIY